MYICFVYSEVHKTRNTRQWTFIASLVLGMRNFPDSKPPKQALINAFLSICLPTAALQRFVGQAYTLPAASLTTQDVSNRKSTTNVWIVQMIMKNYYSIGIERSSMSSMRQILARAAHKAVLCALSAEPYGKRCIIYHVSTVYLPYIYRVSTVVGNGKGHKNRLSEIVGQPVLYQVVYLRRIAKCDYQLITNPACTLIPACA